MALSDFEVRQTQQSDMHELNSLYHLLTGIERSSRQFDWEWFDGFEGPAPSWVIVEKTSNRIAGHHGVIPVPLTFEGKRYRGARTENTMVHPDFRGKFPYHVVEAQLLKQLLLNYDAIFTTAGKGAQAVVRRRLGYVDAGRWQTNKLFSTTGYLARRLASKVVQAKPTTGHVVPVPHGDFVVEATDFAEFEIEMNSMPGVPTQVCIANDTAYFRWRLSMHPYGPRQVGVFSCSGSRAVAAWTSERRAGAVSISLEHFACSSMEHEIAATMLRKLCRSFALTAPVSVYLRCVENAGFLSTVAKHLSAMSNSKQDGGNARLLVRSDRLADGVIWNASAMLMQGV